MVWNNFDCYDLIVDNLTTMIKLLEKSDDHKKQFKIDSYRNALNNIPYKTIYSMRDFGNSRIAGPSIMEKIKWILDNKMNLPEVEEVIARKGKSKETSQTTNERAVFVCTEDVHSCDEESYTYDEDEHINSEEEASSTCHQPKATNKEEDFRTVYLSTICHIEGAMYQYLDTSNPKIKQILRKFKHLRNQYSVIES